MSSVASSENPPLPPHKVKRKPPPTINLAEKYPSPDPSDPFAPLWVLRNRTSSALGQNPLVTEANPSPFPQPPNHANQGPFGAILETSKISSLNSIPMERRRSNSYLYSQSNIPPVNIFQVPPRSSSTIPSTSTTGEKLGSRHGFINRPPSQVGFAPVSGGVFHGGVAQTPTKLTQTQTAQQLKASDVTAGLARTAQGHVSPPRVEPIQNEPRPPAHPQPRAAANITRCTTVDRQTPDHSSGAETESEGSVFTSAQQQQQPQEPVDVKVKSIDIERHGKKSSGMTTTVSFNVGVDVKPKLLRRATSSGTSNSVAASFSGKESRPSQPPQQQQHQSRLAKFLLSKKTSHDGYMADGEKKASRGNARAPVHKAGISAPLTDTFVHQQGESKAPELKEVRTSPERSAIRGAGDYTSDTDAEESTSSGRFRAVKATKVLFRGPARKKTSIDDSSVIRPAYYLSDNKAATKGPDVAEVVVTQRSAVKVAEKKQAHPKGDDIGNNKERYRAEMSWAEVNIEDYYTPAPSPRVSYPTPAPSPEPKPAQELEPEPAVSEKDEEKKVVKEKEARRATMEVSSPLPNYDPPAFSKVQEQPTRVRNLKSTKQHAIPIPAPLPTPISPPTTTLISPPSSIPVSASAPTIPSSSTPAPPPPPKISKRRTSSSVPSAAQPTEAGNQILPSTQSISNTSIVHVTLISSPTPTPLGEHEEDAGAYVRPRRAPKPPGLVGGVSTEGVQSEPEPVRKEVIGLRWEKAQEGERERKEKAQEGRKTIGPSKAMSEDESHMPRRQYTEGDWKETAAKTTIKSGSRLPVSVLKNVKHGRAASTDIGLGRDGVVAATGSRTGETEGSTSKKPITASVSGPVSFPSREKQRALSPPPSSQPPRPAKNPKEKTSDLLSQPSSSSLHVHGSSEYTVPTASQLLYAASLPVYAEDGRKLLFRNVFEKQKTVVVFIRHFWCPNCQDYMTAVRDIVHPEMLIGGGGAGRAEVDEDEVAWKKSRAKGGMVEEVELEIQDKISIVVISNGAHGMITKYRQMLSLPFRVYTDPTLALYKALGMGKTDSKDYQAELTENQHPDQPVRTNYHSDSVNPVVPKKKRLNYSLRRKAGADTSMSSLSERDQSGGYAKHGLMSGFAMVVVRAIKVGMPVWEKGGDSGQLGGEFVFGPGLVCSYAHRMQSTKGHAAIEEVLQAAGVRLIREPSPPDPPTRPSSPLTLPPPASTIQKRTLAHKQAQSVDLASPPKSRDNRPPAEVAQTGIVTRKRRESLKPLRETLNLGRSSIAANANHAPLPHRVPSLQGNRERINDMHSAIPVPVSTSSTKIQTVPPTLPSSIKAVLTREEEEAWLTERQRAIEQMQEKKNVRRVGELGRAPSSQGNHGAAAPSQSTSRGYVHATSAVSTNRAEVLMTESRSAPIRSLEEEDKILYKAENRRPQERTRHDVQGHGYLKRISTVRVGHPANTFKR